MNNSPWKNLLLKIHRDESGAVSLETILIIGAIALPVLIFLIRVGWPKIKGTFISGIDQLDSEATAAKQ
jgi:Flp pilus assembly pilin Flp